MATEQQKRYFEFQDAKSAKFWEVTTDGTAVTVRYGKIGTNGQSQTKELADAAAAAKHVAKLVAEKTGKGYVESGDSAVAQAASEPVSEVAPTAPRKKATPSRKTSVTNPAKDPEASPESLLALLDKDDATNRLLARPLCQTTCRAHRTVKLGALMEEQVGQIRTSIQGQSRGAVAAA